MAITNKQLADLLGTVTVGADHTATLNAAYQKAFGRDADAEGLAYWSDRLDNGLAATDLLEALLDGADAYVENAEYPANVAVNATDKTTIVNKAEVAEAIQANTAVTAEEAATILATVTTDASKTTALDDVAAIVSGETFVLTTGTDSFVGTADNDLFTSANGTLAQADTLLDSTTTDNDILNIETTSTAGAAARMQNIETVNVNGTYVGVGFDATNVAGTQNLNLSTSIIGGTANVIGASSINTANVNAGTNISTLNVTSAAGGTRDVVNVDGGSASAVNITGNANGIDKFNTTIADGATLAVTANGTLGEYTANVGTTATVTAATPTGIKTFTINAASDSVVTTSTKLTDTAANLANTDFNGAGNVTLKATAANLTAQSMTSTGTGTLTVEISDTAAANGALKNIAADNLKFTLKQTNTAAITVNESTVVHLADTADTAGAAKINVSNGTSTEIDDGAGTLNVKVAQSQASFTTDAKVGTLLLEATPDNATDTQNGATITIGDLITDGETSTVVVSGSEALTLSDVTHTEDLVVTSTQLTGKLVVTDTSSTADKDITIIGGTNDDKVTMTVVASTVDTNNIILTGAGNDTITLQGATTTTSIIKAYGEAGNDTINADALTQTTAAKEIVLDGGAGNDIIIGSDFIDTIFGGTGDDRIAGGTGADTITTGAGSDVVTITAASTDNVTITDAVIGEDTIVLTGTANNAAALDLSALTVSSGSYAAKLGTNHSLTLTGSTVTDLSGLVQLGQKAVAATATEAAIAAVAYTAADFDLVSGSANDNIVAGDANLNAGAGDDLITTGKAMTGTNALTGGAGADTFKIGHDAIIADLSAGDVLNVTAGTVGVSVTEDFTATAATSNAVATTTLTLKDGVDVDMTLATISAAANGYIITTDNAGDDQVTQGATIVGSRGNDTITGSQYADTITGGEGVDTITATKGADTIILTESVTAADVYDINAVNVSAASVAADTIVTFDTLHDFASESDKIDIAGINATLTGGGAATSIAVTAVTTGAGSLADTTIADFAELKVAIDAMGLTASATAGTANAYTIDLTGNTGALGTGKYLLINNGDTVYTADDVLIELTGTDTIATGDFTLA